MEFLFQLQAGFQACIEISPLYMCTSSYI